MNRKISQTVLLGLPALVFLACASGEDESSGGDKEPKNIGKPDLTVTAGTIIKDFDDNELAADKKYKGKVLKVTGKVNEVDTEIFDDEAYVLRVGDGGDFDIWTVNCNDAPSDQLSDLEVGQKVAVIGVFDDGGDLGIELKDCRVA